MLITKSKANFSTIFRLIILLVYKETSLAIQTDDGMCDVVQVNEFNGLRLNQGELEMYCNMDNLDCFFKCLKTAECLSFAVGKNESCTETFCLLYSISEINSYLVEDSNLTYYFMGSSCCYATCLNGGMCRSKVCTCACRKGFTSQNCTSPTNNVTGHFSHEWKTIEKSSLITQIDAGDEQTWATRSDNNHIFSLQGDTWIQADGSLKHVSVGKWGVWGVNRYDEIWFRLGIAPETPYGTGWRKISGGLKQIDAGSSGVVYGVNSVNKIYCRAGITDQAPHGNTWTLVDGKFKYVSCGDYGCWAIRLNNSIAFRTGVTFHRSQGTGWIDVDGSFVQLEAGYKGRVYAVTADHRLYYRVGICTLHPTGRTWQVVEDLQVKHVAVDKSVFVIAMNGTIYTTSTITSTSTLS